MIPIYLFFKCFLHCIINHI